MKVVGSALNFFALLALCVLVPALRADDGLSRALARLRNPHEFASSLRGSSIAAADFNHDQHLDAAVLVRGKSAFHIEMYFVARQMRAITFTSPVAAMTMSAQDVNRDGYADLVIRELYTYRPLFVWLNDRRGSFQRANLDAVPRCPSDGAPRLGLPTPAHESLPFPVSTKSRSRHVLLDHDGRDARSLVAFCCSQPAFPPTDASYTANPLRAPPSLQILGTS